MDVYPNLQGRLGDLDWKMKRVIRRALLPCFFLALSWPALSDSLSYEQAFTSKVIKFANHNRLNRDRLHKDVHHNCYILVTIDTVIRRDGSVKSVSVVNSSSVPVVDRYFQYVIEQAAPFQALANHYDPVPEEIIVTHEFRLDVMLWSQGVSATRECDKLKFPAKKDDE